MRVRCGSRDLVSPTKLAAPAVQCIAYNWMPQRCQMNPNLVGPSSLDLQLQQAKFPVWRIQLALNRVMGGRFTSTHPPRRHSCASYPVAADAAADRPTILLQPALHQGHVFLLYQTP